MLLSTVPSDSHTWNLVFLQMALEELGYSVTNLGPCVPESLLVGTAEEMNPNVIVISSVNGHGYSEGKKLIRRIRAKESLGDVPVMIGGKLGIDGADEVTSRALLECGYTAVFSDEADVDSLTSSLERLDSGAYQRQACLEQGRPV